MAVEPPDTPRDHDTRPWRVALVGAPPDQASGLIAQLEANAIAVVTNEVEPDRLGGADRLHAITLWTAAAAPTPAAQMRELATGYPSLLIVAICPPEDAATLAPELPADVFELVETDQLFRMPRIIKQWFERTAEAPAEVTAPTTGRMDFASSGAQIQPRLLAALEASSAGFALFDANGALTYANAGYAEIACGIADLIKPGVTLSELRRVSLERGLVAQAIGREEAWLAEREQAELNQDSTELLRIDSGRWVQNHVGPLDDGGSFHILADISQQKASESELLRSEQRLRDFISAAASWLWETDANDRYVFLSPGFERVTGHDRRHVLGRTREEVRSDYIRKRTVLASSQDSDTPGRYWRETEIEFLHGSGETRYCLNTSVPIRDDAGEVTGHRGAIRDITATRLAEERAIRLQAQLHRAQRAEVAGQVAGGIAHDFNNLLASILGYCELALRQPEQAQNPRMLKYLSQIRLAGTRGRDLISKLLTYSGATQTEPRPHDLNSLLEDSLALARGTLPASVSIHANLAPGLPLVEVDPISFEQVIMNLCINARDAMTERGLIVVEAKYLDHDHHSCVSCGKDFEGRYVAISIRDSGPGVASSLEFERLFEPFFSTKGAGKGTGMGLAVVHGIVHDFGGHLEATSEPGAGLTVTVLLPATQTEHTLSTATSDRHVATPLCPAGKPIRTVLIIDDEISIGQMLTDFLESEGIEATFALQPAQGIARFKSAPEDFDLVITDLTMPGLSGIEVAEAVRATAPDKPVILCTGYQDRSELADLESPAISAVLNKPIDLTHLLSLLRSPKTTANSAV